MENNAFAEVIESSLDTFLAQSWEWDDFPNFGSLVKVESENYTTLGAVVSIQTGSMDPMRYPFPYKKTENELKEEHPQIFEFLKTTFKVQIVGHIKNNSIFHTLPPKPSKIHAFVSQCDNQTIKTFFSKPDFLHLLFAFDSNINNLDELLLGILRELDTKNLLNKDILRELAQTFSLLTGNDYRRLKLFLQRTKNLTLSL